MLALLASLWAQGPVPPPPEPAPEVAFVHVEANVDAAVAGHAALRIGPHVYHFQQSGGGTLGLWRVAWPAFRHVYAGLQNRELHLYVLDLEPDDAERVAATAARAWVEQERDREVLRRMADDLGWRLAQRDGELPPPLAGVGLLAATGAEQSAAGRALRTTLRERFGEDFAQRRLAQLEPTIRASAGASESLLALREDLTEREAVRALARAAPLDPGAWFDADEGQPLTELERRSLERLLERTRASVLALWSSPRPDRGRALLVATARHHVIARSLAEGRLLTLDAFPDEARVLRPDADEARLTYAPLHGRTRAGFALLRSAILDGDAPSELEYGLLEEAATRSREASRGARGEPVRLYGGRLLPARGRAVALPAVPALTDAAAAAARAGADRRAAEAAWRERHDYDLLARNCATELARLLNSAFDDPADARRALGARLEPGADLGFVPRVLADQVRAGLRLREVQVVRSHLRASLDARGEAGAWSRLREATTFTSTLYAPRSEDGWFLLFTDETVWTRPLFGAVNLGYGLLRGAFGLLRLPFDRGEAARAGVHGAFFSLPELVFVNVRKGTFAHVPEVDDAARR